MLPLPLTPAGGKTWRRYARGARGELTWPRPVPASPKSSRRSRTLKWLLWLLIGGVTSAGALWVLVHTTSWAGPLVANTLRAVVGADNVARLEDTVYRIEDWMNRWRRRGDKPKARWTVPEGMATTASASATNPSTPSLPPFVLPAVGPVFPKWSAPGDGDWVPVVDRRQPDAPIVMVKTLLHPDANRSWAELFVVAIDLRATELRAMPGRREPVAELPVPADFERPGKIPPQDHGRLLAAFNGGFMAEHGHYGMRVQGLTLLKPRDKSCTVVGYDNGSIEIASWKSLAASAPRMSWFRQTPACMFEDGVMHIGLRHPETRQWGATLDGDTVIRRSAIGLDQSRLVLFVGIGNATTARALAHGMRHAGAVDVAQLDVNWSYPKFLTYEFGKDGQLEAKAAMDGFEYSPVEYVGKSALRDFFYVLRRPDPEAAAFASRSSLAPSADVPPATNASTTPATNASTTPATNASTTPAANASTTPAANTSTTPAANTSTTPATNASTTPAANASTTPATNASTTPAANTSTTPAANTSTNVVHSRPITPLTP